jgi:hypothetical protein
MPLHFARAAACAFPLAIALALACSADESHAPRAESGAISTDAAVDADSISDEAIVRTVGVTLRDRAGSPVHGVPVTWSARDGGTITPQVSISDKSGHATAEWQLGPDSGQHVVVATARGFRPATIVERLRTADLAINGVLALDIPTFDGSNQTVHPDFARVSDEGPLHGAHLVLTPYPFSNNALELPALYRARGALRWRVADGTPDPLVQTDEYYLSDPDIVYDPSARELIVYYRGVARANTIYQIRSTDGRTWTPPTVVVTAPNHEVVSPSIVRRSATEWLMWSVNTHGGCSDAEADLELRRSADGINWSSAEPVMLAQRGYYPWHVDVQWIPSLGEYWALYNVKVRGSCTTRALYLATSRDGIMWRTYRSPVLSRGVIPELADVVYRSSFAFEATSDVVQFWYSGARYNGQAYVWSSATQRVRRADLFRRLDAASAAGVFSFLQDTPPLLDPP